MLEKKNTYSVPILFTVTHGFFAFLLNFVLEKIYYFCNCLQAAVKCASSPRTNALSTKPRLPLAALAADAARNHPPNNVNSHVSVYTLLYSGSLYQAAHIKIMETTFNFFDEYYSWIFFIQISFISLTAFYNLFI